MRSGTDAFSIREWLGRPTPTAAQPTTRFRCDEAGCIARLADGAMIAVARTPEALAEDCARAALVVTPRVAAPECAAAIDRNAIRAGGALALRRDGKGWQIEAAYQRGYDRPWARSRSDGGEAPTATRPAPRDATPNVGDLEPGD